MYFKKAVSLLLILTASQLYADSLENNYEAYGPSTIKPGWYVSRARGHAGDKERLQTNDVILGIFGNGMKPVGMTTNNPASIQFTTSGNWSNTASGTQILFQTTPVATLVPATIFTVGSSGVNIGVAGTTILKHLSASVSLDFGATAAGACDALTITVTGAADGDTVYLGIPAALAGSDSYQNFWGYVSAANTITVKRCNPINVTTALSDPAAATVRADVWQH